MRREDFIKHFSSLRCGQTVQKDNIRGSYLGEYIDSARMNLEDKADKTQFLCALTEELAEYNYTDSKFNLDQRSRLVHWVKSIDSPYASIFLYVFYEKECRHKPAIASEEECKAWCISLLGSLNSLESFDLLLFAVKNSEELFAVLETQINEQLQKMDPFKMSQNIMILAKAAKRCTGKLKLKLSRAIRLLLDSNIMPSQPAYAVLCTVFGERGTVYLNALSLAQITKNKSDKVFLRFVNGLLDGDIRDEEKELFLTKYTECFCQKIDGYDSVRRYLQGAISLPKALAYKDWLVFYEAERLYCEGDVNICHPYLLFCPLSEFDKWLVLTDWEKQKLLTSLFYKGLKDGSIGVNEVEKYEEFCLAYEKLSLKDFFAAGYNPELFNVIPSMIEAGIWDMPGAEETYDKNDAALLWLRHYTNNPETIKSGTWVLSYYELHGNCPSWFSYDNLDVLKHLWLQKQSQIFREKYIFMFLNCLLLNNPSVFKDKLESICFGNYWKEESIDLRKFMSDASLKKFVSFLMEDVRLKDRNDIFLRYSIGEESYRQKKAEQDELDYLVRIQTQIADKLTAWLNKGYLTELRYSPIYEISILQQEVLLKVIIPSFKDKLSINQNLGEFAYNMSELANDLSGEMQVRVLLELANEIKRIEGEQI